MSKILKGYTDSTKTIIISQSIGNDALARYGFPEAIDQKCPGRPNDLVDLFEYKMYYISPFGYRSDVAYRVLSFEELEYGDQFLTNNAFDTSYANATICTTKPIRTMRKLSELDAAKIINGNTPLMLLKYEDGEQAEWFQQRFKEIAEYWQKGIRMDSKVSGVKINKMRSILLSDIENKIFEYGASRKAEALIGDWLL